MNNKQISGKETRRMIAPNAVEDELNRMNLRSARVVRKHITDQHNEILRLRNKGWQPIEFAPKEGRSVLICTREGVIALCRWEENFDSQMVDGEWKPRGAWTDDTFADLDLREKEVYDPIYWMVAPSPPEDSETRHEQSPRRARKGGGATKNSDKIAGHK